MKRLPHIHIAVALLLILGFPGLSTPAEGPPGAARPAPSRLSPRSTSSLGLSTFAVIHSAVVADYQAYQFKFTYLGAQVKVTPSLGGTGSPHIYNQARFLPYERSFGYGNDRAMLDTLTVSAAEFKAFLDALAPHPSLTDTTLRAKPVISLMVLEDAASIICWEHLAPTAAQTDSIFSALHDALPDSTRQHIVDIYRHQMAGVRR